MPEQGDLSPDGCSYWNGPIWQWQPLWLTADDVVDAAYRRFGVSATSATYLASGALNQSWRVDDHVLRVSRPEQGSDQIAYEHGLVQGLAVLVDVVPAPVVGRDGATIQRYGGRLLSLFPHVAGSMGAQIDRADYVLPAAEVIGRIHAAGRQLSVGQRPGCEPFAQRPRHPWQRVGPILRRELDHDATELLTFVERAAASVDAWLDQLPGDRVATGLIHGDFNDRNVLFSDDRLVAVIDWDGSRIDPFASDVCGLVLSGPSPERVWETYLGAGGPMSPSDLDLLPAFARLGTLSELQWAVDDGHATPTAVPKLHEIAESLALLEEAHPLDQVR